VKTLSQALRKTLELKVMKRAVGISARLWERKDWTLWRDHFPMKQNKRHPEHIPWKR
jgi:hypothetical protein